MSLERLTELPYYLYHSVDINDYYTDVGCADSYFAADLLRYVRTQHTIIDDRVIRAMSNKADCLKQFFLKGAWTVGFVFDGGTTRYNARYRRTQMFGERNAQKTYLQEKLLNKYGTQPWSYHYVNDYVEISNVDKARYEQSVRNLIKAVR